MYKPNQIIKNLPIDPGISGWNAIINDKNNYETLETNINADWVIIGAGWAGLSAARRLTQLVKEDKIVVLDAKTIGEGPAGRNSGFMIDVPHNLSSDKYEGNLEDDKKTIIQNKAAINFSKEAFEEYKMPKEAFDMSGKINAAATKKGLIHNLNFYEHLKKLNENSEIIDEIEMKNITGSNYYKGGIFNPGTVMTNPALFINKLANGLSSIIKIYHNSPVIKMIQQNSSWKVLTLKGSVSTSKVILAVNGHVESFGHFKDRLMHVFTYASLTKNMTKDEIQKLSGHQNWSITPSDTMGSTLRRISGLGGNRILIRNTWTYNSNMITSNKSMLRAKENNEKSFLDRFPNLRNIKMEYQWGGRSCITLNNTQVFGEIEKNMFSACCQNVLGTVRGTFNGMVTADYAAKGNSLFVNDMLNQEMPKKLYPKLIMDIGANIVLRIKEFKAGKEK